MTVLGAAANHKSPGLISARFYTHELNKTGAVIVSMFVNGQEEWILMDDYLPFSGLRPSFVHSKQDGEAWPCLLEKAWAKLHGSYARVESG